jgi:hypothetical protein
LWRNSTESCTAYIETKKELEARSYRHWLFLTTIKGKVVFNDYSYSKSTNGHQSEVRRLINGKYKIDLIVDQYASLDKGIDLFPIYRRKFLNEIRLSKKGVSKKSRESLEREIKSCDDDLKKILKVKICKDLSKKEKLELKSKIALEETDRLERNRRFNKTEIEKRKSLKPDLEKIEPINIESLDAELDSLNQINF